MKRKFISLLLLFPLMTSCSNKNVDEYVSYGFHKNPFSMVSIALKAKKEQPFEATFDISAGAVKTFIKGWKSNEFKCNPGYGTFAINRVIFYENKETFDDSSYTMLYDFPNEEKYLITTEYFDSEQRDFITHYSSSISFTYDFSLMDINAGYIGYYICYYDDINNKEFDADTGVYGYGIDFGDAIKFKKNNENKTVIFSRF